LLKTSLADVDALIRIIEAVAQGDTVLDPAIAQQMAEAASDQSEPDRQV
jgi:DNA-binding NarL/FixJ family response regulator